MVEVLITGSPRTGTTAITEWMCHDEGVFVTNEANTYNVSDDDWRALVEETFAAEESVLKRWVERKGFTKEDMLEGGPRAWRDRMAQRGFAIFGDKTPTYVYDLERIIAENPGMRLVLTVRDCRDVVSSSLLARRMAGDKALHWMHESIQDAASMWTQAVRNMLRVFDWMDPADFLLLKYEDSVRHPRATLRRLSQFLGHEIRLRNPTGGYRPTNIGRWRQEFPDMREHLPAETLRCMEVFGYDWLALETSWLFGDSFADSGWEAVRGVEFEADGRVRMTGERPRLQSAPIEVRLGKVRTVSMQVAVEPLQAVSHVQFTMLPMFDGTEHFSYEMQLPLRVTANGEWQNVQFEMPTQLRDRRETLIRVALEVDVPCAVRFRRVDLTVRSS